ncbi:DUF4132 domain-containing protein [Paenibacillus sp. NPDC058071]|uniref:DUF4132 domain-containing protein n=1 Tax=Paenibacillus sp. NPDC058071 TaxID=3346326 RepID=UPI0036DE17A3
MADMTASTEGLDQFLIEIGLDGVTAVDCVRYIEGAGELPSGLPVVVLERHDPKGIGQIWYFIRKFHLKGLEHDLISRLLTVMLHIGRNSFLELSSGYTGDVLWRRGCLTMVSSYDVPLGIVWEWFLEHSELSERLEKHQIAFFDHIAQHDPAVMQHRAQTLSSFNELLMAVSLEKAGQSSSDIANQFEQAFIQCIECELQSQQSGNQTTSLAKSILNAIISDAENAVIQPLMRQVKWDYNDEVRWLYKAVYLAEETDSYIPFSASFIRVLIIWDPSFFYKLSSRAIPGSYNERQLRIPNYYERYGLPREVYIIQLAKSYDNLDMLRAELLRDRACYERAILRSSKVETLHLCRVLWEIADGHPYLEQMEEQILLEVEDILQSEHLTPEELLINMAFFRGAPLSAELRGIWSRYKINGLSFRGLHVAEYLWSHSLLFNRVVCFLAHTDEDTLTLILRWCSSSHQMPYSSFIDAYRQAGGAMQDLMPFIVNTAQVERAHNDDLPLYQLTLAYVKANMEELSSHFIAYLRVPKITHQAKSFVLTLLMTHHAERHAGIVIPYLADESKTVRNKAVLLLSNNMEQTEAILPLLDHKKTAVRERVVCLLSQWDKPMVQQALQALYAKEKNEKIKELIANALQDKLAASTPNASPVSFTINTAHLNWLELASLPRLRMRESDDIADETVTHSILNAYVIQEEIVRNWKAQELAAPLKAEDLAELAEEVLQRWLREGAPANKKWVMAFAAVFGDGRVVLALQARISSWPLESRGAIACDAVKALLLSPLDSALLFIDQISRNFKFKQVKQAAVTALGQAAELLGISTEELADRVVPHLGFDAKGCRTVDYGPRQFKLQLMLNHDIRITDGSGKHYKTLPVAAASDDAELAEASLLEAKQLKKQLKTVAKSVQTRLEQSFAMRRYWTYAAWHKLFVDNPVMHAFASGLIWGVYADDVLISTFRYREDDSFISADESAVSLSEGDVIALVHPLDLEEGARRRWMQQFEDYEMTQPFPQLTRNTFTVMNEEENALNIMRFTGVIINGLSLLSGLTKFGWSKGSILDAGAYIDFYKEFESIGIGVQLTISDLTVGMEDETVTIYEMDFYRAGKVARGSYIYSEIMEEDRIQPIDVPKALFSELLYEVDTVLAKRLGVDEDWQLNRRS